MNAARTEPARPALRSPGRGRPSRFRESRSSDARGGRLGWLVQALLRVWLTAGAIVLVVLADDQRQRVEFLYTPGYSGLEAQTKPWLSWVVLAILAGLLFALAARWPYSASYAWGRAIWAGLAPGFALGYYVLISEGVWQRNIPLLRHLPQPSAIFESGPQMAFAVMLGAALGLGLDRRERRPSGSRMHGVDGEGRRAASGAAARGQEVGELHERASGHPFG